MENDAKPVPEILPGEAAIKPQYIVRRVQSVNSSLSDQTPTTMGPPLSDQGDQTATTMGPPLSDQGDQTATTMGPPPEKRRKKERGQNKRRPRAARVNHSDQLCPSLFQGSKSTSSSCLFGDKCRYSHDCAKFLADKPPDIGDTCFLFTTLGRCPYGLACRYGNSHVTADQQNVINEDVYDPNRVETTLNIISRTLQEKLRKRKVELPKSDCFLRKLGAKDKGRRNVESESTETVTGEKNSGAGERGREAGERGREGEGVGTEGVEAEDADVEERVKRGEGERGREEMEGEGERVRAEMKVEGERVRVEMNKEERGLSDQEHVGNEKTVGALTDEDMIAVRQAEKKQIDFSGKLYLAPLTTVGNLPFRRICKEYGADITCGEMAMATNLLQGQQSEWALLKRHCSEDLFGVQVCGAHTDSMTRCAEVIARHAEVDFIDVNVGCPIDLVCNKGAGCSLMDRRTRFGSIVQGMTAVAACPVTVKMRAGVHNRNWNAHKLLPQLREWGVAMTTVHGRSKEQRYTKVADWDYISRCSQAAHPMPVFGCGDVLSFKDHDLHSQGQAGIMIARGALIKPWIFTEIKEKRHWDISSSERLEMLRRYTNYGLEHWGSDTIGVENTRRFLLEWLSFLYRYIPVGVLERVPQKINERPPQYLGRDDLETLMASHYCQDWIKISEMLLGPVPGNFTFLPKHKANSYL